MTLASSEKMKKPISPRKNVFLCAGKNTCQQQTTARSAEHVFCTSHPAEHRYATEKAEFQKWIVGQNTLAFTPAK